MTEKVNRMTKKELTNKPADDRKKSVPDEYESIFDYVSDLKADENPDNFRLNWSKIEEITNYKNK